MSKLQLTGQSRASGTLEELFNLSNSSIVNTKGYQQFASLSIHQPHGSSCLLCGVPQSASMATKSVGFSCTLGGKNSTVGKTSVVSEVLCRLLYMMNATKATSTAATSALPTAIPAITPAVSPVRV